MKRAWVVLLATLLALMAAGSIGSASAAAAARVPPKVALIVGPAGAATDNYRRLANEAAEAAAKFTPNVVRVYSPDATWPAVKQALRGASIVVYLGHGNGWPSKYRSDLTPETQNGMGLNPNAGAGDSHQYFGEGRIGSEVQLAKSAVVILSHLCYASGNSEPGLPEGSLAMGQQRVDNYAAGFIRAGASAVIAEAHMGPAYYVRALLSRKGSIDRIWRDAPTYHGNLLRFNSLRSPGFTAQMDTDRATSGFHRSIVLRGGLAAASVMRGAVRAPQSGPLPPIEPSLAGLGIEFDAPDLASPPTAGASTSFTFKLAGSDPAVVPDDVMVAVRWDPLDGGVSVPAGASIAPAAAPSPAASPGAGAGPSPAASPTTPAPTVEPDPIDLVTPEVTGEIVAPVAAKRTSTGIAVPVRVPRSPGLYRLVGTIHGPDGVAYDAATQALMPALIVRVTGALTAVYDAPATAFATAGGSLKLGVRVTNMGATPWGAPAILDRMGGAEAQPARRATLVAQWVDVSRRTGAPAREGTSVLPAGLAPGSSARAVIDLVVPSAPGDYLVLLDVVTPRAGSLTAAGVPPGIVRVTVSEGSSPTAP
jgi:hypothetical protein